VSRFRTSCPVYCGGLPVIPILGARPFCNLAGLARIRACSSGTPQCDRPFLTASGRTDLFRGGQQTIVLAPKSDGVAAEVRRSWQSRVMNLRTPPPGSPASVQVGEQRHQTGPLHSEEADLAGERLGLVCNSMAELQGIEAMHMIRKGRSEMGSARRFQRTSGLCRRAIRYRRLTPIYSIGTARRSAMVNPIFVMKPRGVYKSMAGCACKMEERNSGCQPLHLFG
jgi:hypothetical protein